MVDEGVISLIISLTEYASFPVLPLKKISQMLDFREMCFKWHIVTFVNLSSFTILVILACPHNCVKFALLFQHQTILLYGSYIFCFVQSLSFILAMLFVSYIMFVQKRNSLLKRLQSETCLVLLAVVSHITFCITNELVAEHDVWKAVVDFWVVVTCI
jgi:hypothetical protein